ncbi:MAG: hypothetical protein ACI8ZX_002711, partial [Planctomycetota bacterium]
LVYIQNKKNIKFYNQTGFFILHHNDETTKFGRKRKGMFKEVISTKQKKPPIK